MGGTVRVVTIRGIPVNVHVSWLVIYGLITWTLAVGYFPRTLPDLPAVAYWANGLLAAFLLFVSVLLHELSHSLVAIAHGLSVRGITLHVFGGVSHLEDEPPTPRAEFLIAVVGPITSFAIAAVLWAINAAGLVRPAWAQAVVAYLVLVNVVVGIFNLVPGFPLDGGRLLRAALWKWKGTLGQATYVASRVDVVTVPIDATVAQLADAFWAHHVSSFPVVDGGGVRGIASVQQVHSVPAEQRTQRRASDLMRPLTDDLVVGPDASVFDALGKASRNEVGRLAVVSNSRLVGYLSLKDITHVLTLRGLPGGAADRGVGSAPRGPQRRAA